jgi:hypothetical protein
MARGGAYGGKEFADRNGEFEHGNPHMIDPQAKAAKIAKKHKGEGFKRGGATKKRAEGGSADVDEDNIVREPAHAKDAGRKRGGADEPYRKEGGKVEGEAPMEHLGRRARGGRTSGAPFSSAHKLSDRMGKSDAGHECE